jgi:hypothetical protein
VSTVNRADLAHAAAFWDAVAERAKVRSQEARGVLDAAAREELQREGYAPTWRIPGLGTVPLQLTSPAVDVADEAAYVEWVARNYPGEIETTRRVRPAFDAQLRRGAIKRGDPPTDAEGSVIPGLVYRAGGKARGIQIRPDDAAKEHLASVAEAFLDATPVGVRGEAA